MLVLRFGCESERVCAVVVASHFILEKIRARL